MHALAFVDKPVEVVVDAVNGEEPVTGQGQPDRVAQTVVVVVHIGPRVDLFGGCQGAYGLIDGERAGEIQGVDRGIAALRAGDVEPVAEAGGRNRGHEGHPRTRREGPGFLRERSAVEIGAEREIVGRVGVVNDGVVAEKRLGHGDAGLGGLCGLHAVGHVEGPAELHGRAGVERNGYSGEERQNEYSDDQGLTAPVASAHLNSLPRFRAMTPCAQAWGESCAVRLQLLLQHGAAVAHGDLKRVRQPPHVVMFAQVRRLENQIHVGGHQAWRERV